MCANTLLLIARLPPRCMSAKHFYHERAWYLRSNLLLTSLSPTNPQTCCCDRSSTGVLRASSLEELHIHVSQLKLTCHEKIQRLDPTKIPMAQDVCRKLSNNKNGIRTSVPGSVLVEGHTILTTVVILIVSQSISHTYSPFRRASA